MLTIARLEAAGVFFVHGDALLAWLQAQPVKLSPEAQLQVLRCLGRD